MDDDRNLGFLHTPPSPAGVEPPVQTRAQLLPFEALAWQDFEKLCWRLVKTDLHIEDCRLYGVQGSNQQGIDIYARRTDSYKYSVFQCKNESDFGPQKIKSAVEDFLKCTWVQKSDTFVLCLRESLRLTARLDEFEKQVRILSENGIALQSWDGHELSLKLKSLPQIVDDFFGREWVRAFCGDEVANGLHDRLDARQLTKLRSSLHSLYTRIFNTHDRGIPESNVLPFRERYVLPIVEVTHDAIFESERLTKGSSRQNDMDEFAIGFNTSSTRRQYTTAVPIEKWIGRQKKTILLGEPGIGKSAFLRYLALDLLSATPTISEILEPWGDSIPVWIPFALWSKVVGSSSPADGSVKGIITAFFKSWDGESELSLVQTALRDKRLLLLVDGIDEYIDDKAARIAWNHLESYLQDNDISIIATSRPRGLDRLNLNTETWQRATLAGLTAAKQRSLAKIWFSASTGKLNPGLDAASREKQVEHQTSCFVSELSRSGELRILATNPLFLCLLISFQISKVRLPLGRFEAYAKLIDYMIETHPSRRIEASGAITQDRGELTRDYLIRLLANLAYRIQNDFPTGIVEQEVASKISSEFLMDEDQGLGMKRHEATGTAEATMVRVEETLGLLVRRSQSELGFFHDTIQTYLASLHLSEHSLESQLKEVRGHVIDPKWHDVLLCLVRLNSRLDEKQAIIDEIGKSAVGGIDELTVDELLAQIAFGDVGCPPRLVRSIAEKTFCKIESGAWMPHRIRLLRHVLNGSNSPLTGDAAKDRIGTWFPRRVGWGMDSIFEAMSKWKSSDDLTEALVRGLFSEHFSTRIAAAKALSNQASGSTSLGKRLLELSISSDDLDCRAAAIYAVTLGWKDTSGLKEAAQHLTDSPHPASRIYGINAKIALSCHSKRDLQSLIVLSDDYCSVDYASKKNIPEIILRGWTGEEEVKQLCLRSLSASRHRQSGIDRDIALRLIIEGFPMDNEVASFCADELCREHSFFNSLHHEGFMLLTRNFKGNRTVIEALDRWLDSAQHMLPEVSWAARVGATPKFKQYLLSSLDENFAPHWSAEALLEGWGSKDAEVRNALTDIINSGAKKLSRFGHLVPRILDDDAVSRNILLDAMKDPEPKRYDFVLAGLIALKPSDDDPEVVGTALQLIEKEPPGSLFFDGFAADLIINYSSDDRVRSLASRVLHLRDGPYWAVAEAFGDIPEFRSRIIQLSAPLPGALRMTIATHLSTTSIEDDFALSILRDYDHEVDSEIKVQASIGYHSKAKWSIDETDQALEALRKHIVSTGPDYSERRMAAFCGLLTLEKLDLLSDSNEGNADFHERINLRSVRGYGDNSTFLGFLAENWTVLRQLFKEEFWSRLFDWKESMYLWNELAAFADKDQKLENDALRFLSENEAKAAGAGPIEFLARVRPKSDLLLEYCLGTLGIGYTGAEAQRIAVSKMEIRYTDQLVAARIIGEHFGGNEHVADLVNKWISPFDADLAILALYSGWPKGKQLHERLVNMRSTPRGYQEFSGMIYNSLFADEIQMYQVLRRLVRIWAATPRHRFHEATMLPIIDRLGRDDALSSVLTRHIVFAASASEKISFAKLINKSRGLTEDLRKWVHREIEWQRKQHKSEAAYDITTGEVCSVRKALLDLVIG